MTNQTGSRLEKIISVGLLCIFGALIILIIYWQRIQPEHNIVFYDMPQHQVVVNAGQHILLERLYCSDRSETLILKRTIRDGIRYDLSDDTVSLNKGCFNRDVNFSIPSSLLPGYYVYDAYAIYKLNPMRWIRVELQPVQFVVTNQDGTLPVFHDEETILLKDHPANAPAVPDIVESPAKPSVIKSATPTDTDNKDK